MIAIIQSAGIFGIEGYAVSVECDLARGLPRLDIVGLPGASVKESADRVRSSIKNCGFEFPVSRVTLNLAPADTRKEGSIYDLPILLGILVASGQIKAIPPGKAFLGELSLAGELRPGGGMLSMAMALAEAGAEECYVPAENAGEAALAGRSMKVYPVEHLKQLLFHLEGREKIQPTPPPPYTEQMDETLDFAHVMGQENAKRAIEVAVSGGHNLLMCGSPGSGKSMMAKRIRSILPPMTKKERLEVIKIHSVVGRGTGMAERGNRPFVPLHHTVSSAGLAGGGSAGRLPRPGEISMAHGGVLFLDELPEFRKDALEVLRQPMEDGEITLSRAFGKVTYPSRFMLVCAMNPCPCGWYADASGRCRCEESQVRRYIGKLSGPLLDRIDIQVEVQPVLYEELQSRANAESSAAIRRRVLAARAIQQERFSGTDISCNATIEPALMAKMCPLTPVAEAMLGAAFEKLGLTARAYDRVLRVGRTIADLANEQNIDAKHIAESIQYRGIDRRMGG